MRLILLAVVAVSGGCRPGSQNVQCVHDDNCDRFKGGVCQVAPSGNKWCTYPDSSCPSGFRYSDLDVGDGVSGQCFVDVTPGEALWVKQFGTTDHDQGKGIAVDREDNVIAVGHFSRTISPAGTDIISAGRTDIYVIKLVSATGAVVWAKRFGGTEDDRGTGVAVDSENNIYVTGAFLGTVDFGGGPLMSEGDGDGFVLKLAANGDFRWAKKIGGTGGQEGTSISVSDSTVVVAGPHYGAMTVDATTLSSVLGSSDFFVLSVNAQNGATNWIRSFGGEFNDGASSASIDSTGNVVVAARYRGTVNFGGGAISSQNDSNDIVMLKLAATNGAHLFSKRLGGPGDDNATAIVVDSANNIFITGYFEATADFECSASLVASQADVSDVFLAKYSQASSCLWAKEFGGTGGLTQLNRQGRGITVNQMGDVAITGGFCGVISFGGPTFVSASECPTSDIFAARFAGGDGRHLNSVRAGGTGHEEGDGVAQSADGRFFVTGSFAGFAEFGREALTSAGGGDAFVLGLAPL